MAQRSAQPLTFEQLGAEDGLVAYETELSFAPSSTLSVLGLRDRAVVFIDDERVGVMEHDGEHVVALPAAGGAGRLTIVVESLGRINYGPLTGEHKGILRGVVLNGRRYVHGWDHRVLPHDAAPSVIGAADGTGLATAALTVSRPADAWIALPGSAKSMVWLNGFLLGRLWDRGPQATLYAPGPLWREGENELTVLDTDRLGGTVEIREAAEYGEVEEFIGS